MDFLSQKIVSSKNGACYTYQLRKLAVDGGVLAIYTYKGDRVIAVPSKDLGKASPSGSNEFSLKCNVGGKLTDLIFVANSSSSLQQWVDKINAVAGCSDAALAVLKQETEMRGLENERKAQLEEEKRRKEEEEKLKMEEEARKRKENEEKKRKEEEAKRKEEELKKKKEEEERLRREEEERKKKEEEEKRKREEEERKRKEEAKRKEEELKKKKEEEERTKREEEERKKKEEEEERKRKEEEEKKKKEEEEEERKRKEEEERKKKEEEEKKKKEEEEKLHKTEVVVKETNINESSYGISPAEEADLERQIREEVRRELAAEAHVSVSVFDEIDAEEKRAHEGLLEDERRKREEEEEEEKKRKEEEERLRKEEEEKKRKEEEKKRKEEEERKRKEEEERLRKEEERLRREEEAKKKEEEEEKKKETAANFERVTNGSTMCEGEWKVLNCSKKNPACFTLFSKRVKIVNSSGKLSITIFGSAQENVEFCSDIKKGFVPEFKSGFINQRLLCGVETVNGNVTFVVENDSELQKLKQLLGF